LRLGKKGLHDAARPVPSLNDGAQHRPVVGTENVEAVWERIRRPANAAPVRGKEDGIVTRSFPASGSFTKRRIDTASPVARATANADPEHDGEDPVARGPRLCQCLQVACTATLNGPNHSGARTAGTSSRRGKGNATAHRRKQHALLAGRRSTRNSHVVGEVGLRKRRPRPPTLKTFGVHTVSVSREDPSLQEH
jgi:hypothetical protein